jgi:hypothetical protein
VDRGVISPGLPGATTTATKHHGGGAALVHCLLADRVGGIVKGAHDPLGNPARGHAKLASVQGGGVTRWGGVCRIAVWPLLRTTSSPRLVGGPRVGTLISCRRTRGWGYDSAVGRLSESPMVAVVVLGTYTVINSISTQFRNAV